MNTQLEISTYITFYHFDKLVLPFIILKFSFYINVIWCKEGLMTVIIKF